MGSQVRSLAAVGAFALVASCGGGGGAPPGVGNAPAPTPAPSPAPAPSPSPAPTYTLATDFTADRQYTGWGVEAVRDYRAPPAGSPAGTAGTATYTVTLKPETLGAGFSYTSATKTYVVRWVDFTKTYGPTVDGLNAGRQPFSAIDDFIRLHPWTDNASQDFARYFGAIRWSRFDGSANAAADSISRTYGSIFGIKTQSSDVPTTGVYSFTFFPELTAVNPPRTADGSNLYVISQSGWTARIDWTTRAITGTLRLEPSSAAPAGTPTLSVAFAGTVEAGGTAITGQFTGTSVSGEFVGNLFGPQGREIGFAYRITIGGVEAYAGTTGSKAS